MSSDETEFDEVTKRKVFRVNVLLWRRDISEQLAMIDSYRDDDNFFLTKGSRGFVKLEEKLKTSRRPPMKRLPKVLYDESWFEEVDERRRSLMLRISKAEFEWLEMEGGMKDWRNRHERN